MKRFNAFIKQLSLTQQLFALIFFFVTFFAVFFFVYINGSVNNAVKEQIFDSLDNTQKTLIAVSNDLDNATPDSFYSTANGITTYRIDVNAKGNIVISVPEDVLQEIDQLSKEWQQMITDITRVINNPSADGTPYHGIAKKAKDDVDSYYSIARISNSTLLITKTYSDNMDKLENVLVKSVVYITVIVVGFFFIILMMWVVSLIHPLNQMRNYIERVKIGKDAELNMNRYDEIGELANALVSMREELRKQEATKEEMIHNISHDLKTPIATIKSYGESIKDGIYPYDTLEKSVDVIIENADRLEQKVHSLLFMNRVEYLISQDCEGISTNMQDIVQTVVQNTKFIKPEITIRSDLQEVYFDGLAEPWRVAVENIVENALRYAKTTIDIHLSQEDGLTIANDGPCLEEDRIKVLFKPYEMGQGGRFGLGLSIVAKVVNANRYEVAGENTADGVIFRINKAVQVTKKGRS